MHKLVIVFIAWACVSLLTLNGCASHQRQKSLNTLDERTRLYGRLLRWREYEAAANLIRHRDESPININLKDYDDLRIVHYEIKTIVLNNEQNSAVVNAEISYYYETRNVVATIRDTQNWWYLPESETWFLDGKFPAF